jgi:hypothetical protein
MKADTTLMVNEATVDGWPSTVRICSFNIRQRRIEPWRS